jgi:hypothetical protein
VSTTALIIHVSELSKHGSEAQRRSGIRYYNDIPFPRPVTFWSQAGIDSLAINALTVIAQNSDYYRGNIQDLFFTKMHEIIAVYGWTLRSKFRLPSNPLIGVLESLNEEEGQFNTYAKCLKADLLSRDRYYLDLQEK